MENFFRNLALNTLSNALIYGAALVALIFIFLLWRQIKRDPRTTRIGFYLNSAIFFGIIGINIIILIWFEQKALPFVVFETIIFLAIIAIAALAVVAGIIINSIKLWQKEAHTFGNLLTPIAFIALLALLLLQILSNFLPAIVRDFISPFNLLLFYFGVVFANYLTSTLIYKKTRSKKSPTKIIVLGGGLIQGHKVGRLLANRIRKGVQVYKESNAKTILMSGGQGPDEAIPEAQAMKEYAYDNHLVDTIVLTEERSRNTYQNLKYSAEIIGDDFDFVTSEYHVFRAALLAKDLKLNQVNGFGAYTPFYYRTTAYIREFVGYLNMHKMRHVQVAVLIVALAFLNAMPEKPSPLNWIFIFLSLLTIVADIVLIVKIRKKVRHA
ncbi:MAG: YdcF family protein [Lactobacillaceae bacterium]|jgi:uncharacterized SAM-binding protein YcdF (DUF218 family)|nr:YdcF family protein [Lactobacillaceae bacterium]